MRYGLPYLGSKNAIAEQIVDILPKANTLYDLFGGGGSITHCAALKHKYKHYVYNDIQQGLPQFFKDCIDGKYTVENCKDFIHREEFFARKDNDWYVKLIWSFGNDGTTYMYGKDIEDYK